MKTNFWKKIGNIAVMAGMFMLLAGCGSDDREVDMSCTVTDIMTIEVPQSVEVVGLGEGSHGVSEYQQMKEEVFQALVQNNGCKTFIIEGDFGGALKVEDYIQGGSGDAGEVVKEIGFQIYRTKEMAELVDWMRSYNENVGEEDKLHFYGMDLQRVDNNKEYLLKVLDQAMPEESSQYRSELEGLTDDQVYELKEESLAQYVETIETIMEQMDQNEGEIVRTAGEEAFEFARECANTLRQCCEVRRCSAMEYNVVRDQYMFEKVEWFLEHGDGSVLFINGHNGHIAKQSVGAYTCLGAKLNESLSEAYFAIGTDARETHFQSQNSQGDYSVVTVSNKNALNVLCDKEKNNCYYVEFENARKNEGWQEICGSSQRISMINVGLSAFQRLSKSFYTSAAAPDHLFDGMIVFGEVSPTSFLE